MDNHSSASSTVIGSSNELNVEEAHRSLVGGRDEHQHFQETYQDFEDKNVQETQLDINEPHGPIHSNQDIIDAPVADHAVVEPSAAEVQRAAERNTDQLQLQDTDTPTTIHAPDGLPRVQGKHFIPRPTLFYLSVALLALDLFVMPVVYYYAFLYGTSLSLQDSKFDGNPGDEELTTENQC